RVTVRCSDSSKGVPVKNPLNSIVRSVKAFGRELTGQGKQEVAAAPARQPKVGVALGGGFARGLAHIGVLKVLEEAQVPINLIAGTSVGSVIGAGYASGISGKELEEIAHLVRFKDFSRWTFSRFGLFSNDKMSVFLGKILRCKTFEELRIPLAVAATDIITGEPAVFTSGDLVDPVRASCAYPGMFLPVNINGQLLVDGLLGHAVPATPLREMGAERVISVHLAAHWVKPRGPRHVFDVIGQCFSIAQDRMCGPWRAASDIVLEPAIGEFGYDDFARAGDLVRAGEEAARAALPQILEWLSPAPATQKIVAGATVSNPASALAK
ncbi:MAG TPA: patatin-like phospholipase family protein, partial [Candidatus Limnocylindrales bacterium]|nr:patatin-like phospholipase family protein [Candidatus Limnocylindrales bacterium]